MLTRNIYLIGFMGSGKSYWGKRLAAALGVAFYDLDTVIEERASKSIPTIFKQEGEAYFRALEKEALETTAMETPAVIGLGGGTPCFFDNMSWIKRHGYSVFLDISVDLLIQRLKSETNQRPLLHNKTDEALRDFIGQKLSERRSYYEQANCRMTNTDNLINQIKTIMAKNPLLLLHGALGSQAQLEVVKQELEDSFEVHLLNFSGHGGNDLASVEFSMDLFTKDVVTYMEAHQLEQVDVFGYSMGGYVALNTARLHPDKIGKIFTLATKFAWSPETSAKEVKMLNPAVIEEKVPAFAKALEERHAPQDWKLHLNKTADMMLALGNGAALTETDFAKVQQQVIVTVGSKDRMVSTEETEAIANVLPNGQFELLEGIPHPIEKVDTAFLAEKIKKVFHS